MPIIHNIYVLNKYGKYQMCRICILPVTNGTGSIAGKVCKSGKKGVRSSCQNWIDKEKGAIYRKTNPYKKPKVIYRTYPLGLDKEEIVYTQRSCLKCGEKFPSKGPYNRLCDCCSISNRQIVSRVGLIPGSSYKTANAYGQKIEKAGLQG